MSSIVFDTLKELIVAWREGNKKTRTFIVISGSLIALGALIAFFARLSMDSWSGRILENIGFAIMATGTLLAIFVSLIQRSKEEVRKEKKIEEVEKRAQENPKETQAAWELAKVKLESYLDRNISQVRSIFWLTVLVMATGFLLIGIGVYEAFQATEHFRPSVLTACSGIIVSFIGGTFLVLYKATMAQAKDYVAILERINAVGMSVQILDTLDDNETQLKQETTAEVAKQLLAMYAGDISHNKTRKRDAVKSSRVP